MGKCQGVCKLSGTTVYLCIAVCPLVCKYCDFLNLCVAEVEGTGVPEGGGAALSPEEGWGMARMHQILNVLIVHILQRILEK